MANYYNYVRFSGMVIFTSYMLIISLDGAILNEGHFNGTDNFIEMVGNNYLLDGVNTIETFRSLVREKRSVDNDAALPVRHYRRSWPRHRTPRGSDNVARRQTIYKLGAVLPFDSKWLFSSQHLHPAGEVALSRIWELGILPNESLTILFRDSKCNEAAGMNQTINLVVEDDIDALLGLVCDFSAAPVARQVTFWNLPLVSVGAMANDFFVRRKDVYPMLTRASPVDLRSMVNAIEEISSAHNWTRIKVLFNRDGQNNLLPACCYLLGEAFVRTLPSLGKELDYYSIESTDTPEKILLEEVGNQYSGRYLL